MVTAKGGRSKQHLGQKTAILAVLALQGVCAGFLLLDIAVTLFDLPVVPISWQYYEVFEVGALAGLVLGVVLGTVLFRRVLSQNAEAAERLHAVSTAFADLVEERFDGWALTKAERDVALFSIKGLTTAEIATLRKTSEGTVKAQTNAIYRKAGVNGRAQLLSLFIEDLFDDTLLPKGRR